MRLISADDLVKATPYPALIDAMAKGLARPVASPLRAVYEPAAPGNVLLSMPAWRPSSPGDRAGLVGIKLLTVYPNNPARGLPSIAGAYVAFDGETGQPIAVLDGPVLTTRRTAAASALAARYLMRPDAKTLLAIGTGALLPEVVRAHASVHRFEQIAIWGRDKPKAAALAVRLAAEGLPAAAAPDLEAAARTADCLVAATTAAAPFLNRAWIAPGAHLSLLGAFTKSMAEADTATIAAARLFADSREAVLEKGGEVVQAIAQGAITPGAIEAELAELIQAGRPIDRRQDDITVFKSVGFAALDLVAAEMVLGRI